jgi:hypothetical protein
METFLACDGRQRVEGGPVLAGVWRWILEPVFHFFCDSWVLYNEKYTKATRATTTALHAACCCPSLTGIERESDD